MPAFLEQLFSHKGVVIGFTVASLLMFVGSLLAVPWLIARAPRDFFLRDQEAARTGNVALKILKNVVGAVLTGAGVLMLLLPGQGILTLIVGLALMDLPGKRALLERLARRPSVLRALNYVRQKTGREPFDAPA
jgi:Putative transmembrane protein (PGPGW)